MEKDVWSIIFQIAITRPFSLGKKKKGHSWGMFLVFLFLSLFSGFVNKCYEKFFTKYCLSPRMHSSWAGWPAYTFFKCSFNCFLGTTSFISLLLIVICSTLMEVVFQMNIKHCYCWVIRFYPLHLSCIYLEFPFLSSSICLLSLLSSWMYYFIFSVLPFLLFLLTPCTYIRLLAFHFQKILLFYSFPLLTVSCRAFLSCSCSKTKTKTKIKTNQK